MVFVMREEQDDGSLGTISQDSSITAPCYENEEYVTVTLQGSSRGDQCEVHLSSNGTPKKVGREINPSEAIDLLIKEAKEELCLIITQNTKLQGLILAKRQRRRSIMDIDMLEGQDFLYQSNLTRWVELKDELDQLRKKYRNEFENMHEELQKIQVQARDHEESLIHDLWQVARESQNTVTGQILSDVVLDQLEERDRRATAEASKVRIQARQLRSRLSKIESAKRKKDQLPGGLHLVDFEQLKMETESLAEKISTKNGEILTLRRKRTIAVHGLSHIREKFQHVKKETKVANERLAIVEKKLHEGRIELCNLKAHCEQITRKKGNMQRSMVNITDPLLLDDLENLKEDAEATVETLKELRDRYQSLQEKRLKILPHPKKWQKNAHVLEGTQSYDQGLGKPGFRWGKMKARI